MISRVLQRLSRREPEVVAGALVRPKGGGSPMLVVRLMDGEATCFGRHGERTVSIEDLEALLAPAEDDEDDE